MDVEQSDRRDRALCDYPIAASSSDDADEPGRHIALKWILGKESVRLEGMTADTLALSLVLGFILGMFPMYGCPTLLCIAAAFAFKLNLPVLQMANVASTLFQLGLLVLFQQAGERLLGACGAVSAAHAGAYGWLAYLCAGVAQAIVGWFCVCVPAGLLLYMVLGYALRRRMLQWNDTETPLAPCSLN